MFNVLTIHNFWHYIEIICYIPNWASCEINTLIFINRKLSFGQCFEYRIDSQLRNQRFYEMMARNNFDTFHPGVWFCIGWRSFWFQCISLQITLTRICLDSFRSECDSAKNKKKEQIMRHDSGFALNGFLLWPRVTSPVISRFSS